MTAIVLCNCADPGWLDRDYIEILNKKRKEEFRLIDETFPKWTNKKRPMFFNFFYGYYLHLRRVYELDRR